MNNITTKGNIGSDPEIKFAGDLAIASFSLAHTPRKKNKTSNMWEDGETMWYRVTFFGTKAEGIVDNYAKGDTVILVGTLSQSTYTNKAGAVITGLEITGNEFHLIGATYQAKTVHPGQDQPESSWLRSPDQSHGHPTNG